MMMMMMMIMMIFLLTPETLARPLWAREVAEPQRRSSGLPGFSEVAFHYLLISNKNLFDTAKKL